MNKTDTVSQQVSQSMHLYSAPESRRNVSTVPDRTGTDLKVTKFKPEVANQVTFIHVCINRAVMVKCSLLTTSDTSF